MSGFGEMQVSSSSSSYQHLAQAYDRLMEDAPYDQWLEFALSAWHGSGETVHRVVDLACGTGSISVLLGENGFQVTGVDLSEEMLAVTDQKAKEKGIRLNLLHQDMRELILPYQADSVVCFCDSINYLREPEDVRSTFEKVYRSLRPGGLFLFDIHSPHKMEHIFSDHTFALAEEDISYIWQCEWDGLEVIHDLTFFVREEAGLFRRFDEIHIQRCFQPDDIAAWLSEAGFQEIRQSADFGQGLPLEDSERIFFTARK